MDVGDVGDVVDVADLADGWEWDDTLFAGCAPHYTRGRLPYAPGLGDTLAGVLGLDGRARLIDVGCGPGTVALALAPWCGEIVGVDPDGGMIAEAERVCAERALEAKARWVRARAEELPVGLGAFDVAVFAQSFHWTDRDLVAATVKGMLRTGGSLVHVSDLKADGARVAAAEGLPHPAVPHAAIGELVRERLGPVRRAGRGVLPRGTPGGEAEILARAGFRGPRRLVVPGAPPLVRTADDVVAGVFSMSFSAPHLFGPHLAAFEADLRRLLRRASPADRFSELPPDTEVFVWGA
ncbi:class I SAM-dependent methyltransferase [Streptomyces sp. NPDC018057]|uniref:class I SAM-dependent methyltransferase n=1 Tax=unclassified Streptomyces TaxID=2593676 RepID=UPI003787271C